MKTPGWFEEIYEEIKETFDFKLKSLEIEVTEKILGVMKNKGTSRSDLAEKLGTSRAAVSKLLNNGSNITLKRLLKICLALGYNLKIDLVVAAQENSVYEMTLPVHFARDARSFGNLRVISRRLIKDFRDKTVRDVYCDEFLNATTATQIKVLREQRGLTQAQLANLAGMPESKIATIEGINYSSWTISTLRKLAKAFDVALTVRFESFGEKLREIDSFSRKALERPAFDEDPIVELIDLGEVDILSGAQTVATMTMDMSYYPSLQLNEVGATFSTASETAGTFATRTEESVFPGNVMADAA